MRSIGFAPSVVRPTEVASQACKAILLVAIAMCVGCAEKPAETSGIHGAGSTFVDPLMRQWIAEYDYTQKNNVDIAYAAVGSGEGNKRFLSTSEESSEPVDFAVSEAPPSDEDLDAIPGKGMIVPITAGSIVIGYNLDKLPPGLKLSREVYVDIFLGKIKFWDDEAITKLNPDVTLPHLPVIVVTRQDSSGTTYAFTSHLDAISDEWHAGPGRGKLIDWPFSGGDARGNESQAGFIANTPGAVGYVQFGIADRGGLGLAVIENAAGNYIEPTAESFLKSLRSVEMPGDFRLVLEDPQGEFSYPLITLVWAIVPENLEASGRDPRTIKFIEWCIGDDAQKLAVPLGYAELPKALREQLVSALMGIN